MWGDAALESMLRSSVVFASFRVRACGLLSSSGHAEIGCCGATAGYTGSRDTGKVRPCGKPCCHRLQSADFRRREQRAATVEALQREVASPWTRICVALPASMSFADSRTAASAVFDRLASV
jgi:hypothetical protein